MRSDLRSTTAWLRRSTKLQLELERSSARVNHVIAKDRVLVCPFCKEAFAGKTVCPEHDLALAPAHTLEGEGDEEGLGNGNLAPVDVAAGRGFVVLGGALAFVGFVGPLCAVVAKPVAPGQPAGRTIFTGVQIATTVAPSYWLLPALAFSCFFWFARTHEVRVMRFARFALALTALMFPMLVWLGARQAIAALRVLDIGGRVSLSWGAALIGGASLALFVAVAQMHRYVTRLDSRASR